MVSRFIMQRTYTISLTLGIVLALGSALAAEEAKPKAKAQAKPTVAKDVTADAATSEEKWISLFNGKNLEGWTPKFVGLKAGENYKDTFRVVDGLLTVSYDKWDQWGNRFGHLFYKTEYSHYKIRAVYRFIGEQIEGGPGWAIRNNGLMLHGQSVASMKLDQDFPDSIEVQLLGGHKEGERTTANLCTPGTLVVYNNKLDRRHCIKSNSKTFRGDQWVTCEVEVRGNKSFRHFVNGEFVMEYLMPQLDDGTLLEKGSISIQAESHPTQFKSIEVLVLKP